MEVCLELELDLRSEAGAGDALGVLEEPAMILSSGQHFKAMASDIIYIELGAASGEKRFEKRRVQCDAVSLGLALFGIVFVVQIYTLSRLS